MLSRGWVEAVGTQEGGEGGLDEFGALGWDAFGELQPVEGASVPGVAGRVQCSRATSWWSRRTALQRTLWTGPSRLSASKRTGTSAHWARKVRWQSEKTGASGAVPDATASIAAPEQVETREAARDLFSPDQ